MWCVKYFFLHDVTLQAVSLIAHKFKSNPVGSNRVLITKIVQRVTLSSSRIISEYGGVPQERCG